eukprot:5819899-Pleurochrysis_carterae.AAC.4
MGSSLALVGASSESRAISTDSQAAEAHIRQLDVPMHNSASMAVSLQTAPAQQLAQKAPREDDLCVRLCVKLPSIMSARAREQRTTAAAICWKMCSAWSSEKPPELREFSSAAWSVPPRQYGKSKRASSTSEFEADLITSDARSSSTSGSPCTRLCACSAKFTVLNLYT